MSDRISAGAAQNQLQFTPKFPPFRPSFLFPAHTLSFNYTFGIRPPTAMSLLTPFSTFLPPFPPLFALIRTFWPCPVTSSIFCLPPMVRDVSDRLPCTVWYVFDCYFTPPRAKWCAPFWRGALKYRFYHMSRLEESAIIDSIISAPPRAAYTLERLFSGWPPILEGRTSSDFVLLLVFCPIYPFDCTLTVCLARRGGSRLPSARLFTLERYSCRYFCRFNACCDVLLALCSALLVCACFYVRRLCVVWLCVRPTLHPARPLWLRASQLAPLALRLHCRLLVTTILRYLSIPRHDFVHFYSSDRLGRALTMTPRAILGFSLFAPVLVRWSAP